MFGKRQFGAGDFQLLERKTLYQGFFRLEECRVRHRLFRGGWSDAYGRELFVRGSAVGVLLYDPVRDRVGLLEQFRVGALEDPGGPWLLEVVAGIIEPGESTEQVARRELVEEAGIHDAELRFMCDYLVSPGGTDERMTLYCALVDLEGKGGIHGLPDENEDIRLHILGRAQAMAGLAAGLCNNAPLMIALQWLALHHDGLARPDHRPVR